MKEYKSAVQRLTEFMSVYEDASLDEMEPSEIIDILSAVKTQITCYISDLSDRQKDAEFHLICPQIDIDIAGKDGDFSGRELIYLPFMRCSVWLWDKLVQEPDNPVFETVKYFCMCVHFLRCKLVMYGVPYDKPLTSKLLDDYGIMDAFEVYRYEHLFRDALQHIEGR
ncbi:hypothetical protein [Roseburia sp. MSJ-14]|uniref:hypothetical protein n=1 Tax=Roseburia sp. MSJ-14 TaxID=2841514 RepID=UPI001C0FCA6A|nr:hypothetical protein [Roseburia sp. MSJ-14]MBU5473604.1 hypothetical protein [Roseburia sp. MSJ-14]